MANSTYQIIDEPKARLYRHLIVPPLAILLIAVFLPLFWTPPFSGRYWMPFLWLMINGLFLGSYSLKYEWTVSIIGALWVYFLPQMCIYGLSYVDWPGDFRKTFPYIRLLAQAFFYLFLYLVVFKQERSYALFSYLKELKN